MLLPSSSLQRTGSSLDLPLLYLHSVRVTLASVCLDKMIESLGLDSLELSRFSINDNAANMKCAIQQSQYLTEYNCDIHTLELCIKYSFRDTPGMLDVLRASKQVAKFVNKSSKAQTQLKDTYKKYKIKFKKPVNPPNTRWSHLHFVSQTAFDVSFF